MNLTAKTYNCRGLNSSKKCLVVNLLSYFDFLFIQEHWLSSSQLSELNFSSPNHYGVGGSGFGSDDVLRERPYGSCAILWRRDTREMYKLLPQRVDEWLPYVFILVL